MYLSRLLLNPRSRQVQRELANPYELHRTLMAAFPETLPKKERVLHRLDPQARTGQLVLLVQSQSTPDWGHLVGTDYLLPADPLSSLDNPAVKSITLPLQAGQRLSFRLRANPTIKKVRRDEETGERRNSNRVPLLREEKQLDWLQKRAEAGGFRLLRATAGQAQEQKIWKKKGARPITLYTVQFDGHLQVQSPEKLLDAVKGGVGPSKAFGCGLLSLGPA